jgi:hypothetical protein
MYGILNVAVKQNTQPSLWWSTHNASTLVDWVRMYVLEDSTTVPMKTDDNDVGESSRRSESAWGETGQHDGDRASTMEVKTFLCQID